MKKTNLLLLLFTLLMFSACDKQSEKEIFGDLGSQTKMKALSYGPQTRGGGGAQPAWAVGERVGVYMQTPTQQNGPVPYTISSTTGMIQFTEPISFFDNVSPHTFYAYHPYEVNTSTNPETVKVAPIDAQQTQQGISDAHISLYEFNLAIPTTIYPDEDLTLYFTSSYSFFEFQISANVSGLDVKNVKLEAPGGKVINFSGATINITLPDTHPDFARYYNIVGGTSETVLTIDGSLSIPNSTISFASAYMAACPFDATGEKLKITVTTTDDKKYEFEHEGEYYKNGNRYKIPLYIEASKQPVIKNIKVLSLCEVGNLGTKDNTKKWTCYYGAKDLHAKELRRLLFEHFGKGKTVETGVISFETIDIKCHLNKVTDAYLDKFDIIYLNNNARPNMATSAKIMNWLQRSESRVLMLAYDWKDACVTPNMSESSIICKTTTNYLIFRDHIFGVTPHWYNSSKINKPIGNWGCARQDMFVPFELNEKTKYFWKDGPFKTNLNENSDQRYWVEDIWWGCAEVSDPNVIPLISYRDARNDCYPDRIHKYGAGDGGMIVGVDPTKRIVYIGDSELFSVACVTSKKQHARMSKEGVCKPTEMNNFSKIMGNLWSWMIQEVVQKN